MTKIRVTPRPNGLAGLEALATSHDARILSLEQQIPEILTQVTSVQEQVGATKELLGDKLDNLSKMMAEYNVETSARSAKTLNRVEQLETTNLKTSIKDALHASLTQKIMWPIIAIIGGVATKLGEYLWTQFGAQ